MDFFASANQVGMENKSLTVIIHPEDATLEVTDKRTGRSHL